MTGRCMRRKYKNIASDQLPLPVFAVSSVDYNAHALGFVADDEFPLPVDTTGIPALRRHCYQFPAKSYLDALIHYREGILAELISSLYMWSSQYKIQRRSALKKVVAKPLKVNRPSVDLCFTGLIKALQEAEAITEKWINEIKLLSGKHILEKSSASLWGQVFFCGILTCS